MATKKDKLTMDIVLSDNKAQVPVYSTKRASGADMFAVLDEPITIWPGYRAKVELGFQAAVPEGYSGFVMPRSGWALKEGITILNTPGLIDPDYTGLWGVILINHNNNAVVIEPGQRIAQLVIVKTEQVEFNQVESLEATDRNPDGFGTTGK